MPLILLSILLILFPLVLGIRWTILRIVDQVRVDLDRAIEVVPFGNGHEVRVNLLRVPRRWKTEVRLHVSPESWVSPGTNAFDLELTDPKGKRHLRAWLSPESGVPTFTLTRSKKFYSIFTLSPLEVSPEV